MEKAVLFPRFLREVLQRTTKVSPSEHHEIVLRSALGKLGYVSVFRIDAAKHRTHAPGHSRGADRWEAELQRGTTRRAKRSQSHFLNHKSSVSILH